MTYSASLRAVLVAGAASAAMIWAGAAGAQTTPPTQDTTKEAATPTGAETPKTDASDDAPKTQVRQDEPQAIIVTGSRIKQDPNNSALPLQIITTQEISRNGISSPEQLLSYLTSNGNSADNLASNSDVVNTERRGNNGASFANLRGQGSAATLVLLNGRRIAAHGTTGAAVDVNQIPFMAIDRVEVLKDGASAIYGTDAIGGVINFITKKDFRGIGASAFTDVTQRGDSPIYRLSAIAGFGDLASQGFNVMGAVGYSWVNPLEAHERSFINTFQHDRGLGVDTRGTPFATIVSLAGTAFPASSAFPLIPGTTTRATGGINLLRLPGQPGCSAVPDMGIYDTDVWGNPSNGLACAFDTGKNVYLQQKINTLTYIGRAVGRLGQHEISLEVTGSNADSDKVFSQVQVTPNTSDRRYAYSLVPGVNDAAYARVYNTLIGAFPNLATTIPYGSGFSYRWRCMECGERQIATNSKTFRAALGIEGPIVPGWDYRAGASYAQSQSQSQLGEGYYYTDALVAALNSGKVNPFLFPGQSQSAEGIAAIQAASARGVVLYGGKYSVRQADASVSGSLFRLPGGVVKLAAGVDFRREEYKFNGDARAVQRPVLAAPFEPDRILTGRSRDVAAAYAELLVPLLPGLEVSAAGRIDHYTGFGTTKNPKVSIKYRPIQQIMFRGSYNTAFRVPTFNQIYDPAVRTLYTGADFADPAKCPNGKVNVGAGCPSLERSIDIIVGGRRELGPETAREFSAGAVLEPSRHFSASVDWWSIRRNGTIRTITLQELFTNYSIFSDRFIRDASGTLQAVDQTNVNAGITRTQGIDITARGSIDAMGGTLSAGIDGTYLLQKKTQVNSAAAVLNKVGVYSLDDDLGLRWKHNAYVTYSTKEWSLSLTQIYRSGYKNQVLPGPAAGTFLPPGLVTDVKPYTIYNLAVSFTGIKGYRLTLGVRNLFDTKPPFAISYDSNNGSGSNWEPRVADPRLRSFTASAEVKF